MSACVSSSINVTGCEHRIRLYRPNDLNVNFCQCFDTILVQICTVLPQRSTFVICIAHDMGMH